MLSVLAECVDGSPELRKWDRGLAGGRGTCTSRGAHSRGIRQLPEIRSVGAGPVSDAGSGGVLCQQDV